MRQNVGFRHNLTLFCNPQNSAILRVTLCGAVASLWRIVIWSAPFAIDRPLPAKLLKIGFFDVRLCIHWVHSGMAGKDSGLRIRVERPLRQAFVDACRKQDRPAAQVIREFMRGFVARYASEADTQPGNKRDRRSPRGGDQGRR